MSTPKVSKTRSRKAIEKMTPRAPVPFDSAPISKRKKALARLSPPITMPSSALSIADGKAITALSPIEGLPPVGDLVLSIRELYRQRDDLLRAEGNLTRQLKAIGKRGQGSVDIQRNNAPPADPLSESEDQGDRVIQSKSVSDSGPIAGNGDQIPYASQETFVAALSAPYLAEAQVTIRKQRKAVERLMVSQTKKLPVWADFESVRGFGPVMLGSIVGVAGDLSLYANPAKLWKRFGLGLVGGERQRKHADAEKAEAHGYSPRRRAVMAVVGKMMLMNHKDEYRTLYLEHKTTQRAKHPELSDAHIDNRAHRYVQKRLLLNLWKAWRVQQAAVTQYSSDSSGVSLAEAA